MVHAVFRGAAYTIDVRAELLHPDDREPFALGAYPMAADPLCAVGTHHRGAAVHNHSGFGLSRGMYAALATKQESTMERCDIRSDSGVDTIYGSRVSGAADGTDHHLYLSPGVAQIYGDRSDADGCGRMPCDEPDSV